MSRQRSAQILFRGGLSLGIVAFGVFVAYAEARGAEDLHRSLIAWTLIGLSVLGGVATLAGALLLPAKGLMMDRPNPEEAPAESFLRLAERAESWIELARRYLILGGVVGGIAWVPLMFLGLFGRSASVQARFLALGGTIAFVGVALLWWRRVVEIDQELREWRGRLAKLSDIKGEILGEQ